MRIQRTTTAFVLVAYFLFYTSLARGESTCDADGIQASGSIYRICMPPAVEYNGSLVIWAHGFQDAGTPVQIPEDQLTFGDVYLPDLINGMGFAFATNSYSKTGLAVRQGVADILDLVELFAAAKGIPDNVYLTGASEGGVITALLMERHPDIFKAGVAACGPVGNFPYQINYFGDSRVVFEYFFPGLIPGDPFEPPEELVSQWTEIYSNEIEPVIFSAHNQGKLDQWVQVARLPFDPDEYLGSLRISVRDVLRYAVLNMTDAVTTLGGFPFDNRRKWYQGSDHDLLLNLGVLRRTADPLAISEMRNFYNTTGELANPLITLHTRLDQQVPYLHELLYTLKTISRGAFLTEHLNIPVDRFEHCNFAPEEALVAFALMLFYAGDLDLLSGVGSMVQGESLNNFERFSLRYHLPYQVEGERLEAVKH